MKLEPLRPKLLSCRLIESVNPQLQKGFSLNAVRHVSLGLVTCDQDDSLYAALDHATKHADVDVVFAKSFYAGSAHSSGPYSGEILGVLAAPHPDEIKEALWALRNALETSICFFRISGTEGPAFFPHVISQTGRYLSAQAGIRPGDPLAYLIAPPLESVVGLDAALKAADVKLLKHFAPPTETNFGGGYLGGNLYDLEAAAEAFKNAIKEIAGSPLQGMVRPEHERH